MAIFQAGDKVRRIGCGFRDIRVGDIVTIGNMVGGNSFHIVGDPVGTYSAQFFELVIEEVKPLPKANRCIVEEVITKRSLKSGNIGMGIYFVNTGSHPQLNVGQNVYWVSGKDLRDLARQLVEIADVMDETV